MRILIFGTGELDCAASNCARALRTLGHTVVNFDPEAHPRALAGFRKSWEARKAYNRIAAWTGLLPRSYEPALWKCAEAFGPELILIIPIHQLSPSVVAQLKRITGARISGWFQDHMVNFGSHEFLMADYDGLFFKDPHIVDRLRDYVGLANIHYLPEACEPTRHHRLPLTAKDVELYGCNVMTYGNLYPYRARLLEGFTSQIRMYGDRPAPWVDHSFRSSWAGFGIYDESKIKAVLGAKVVINTSHFGEVRSVNARLFEVAGIGGFQLADAPGVPEFFEPGKEVATFKGPRMLREMVEYFLAHPEERDRIANAGFDRAHRDHTYAARLQTLFDIVGLSGSKVPLSGNRGMTR